MKEIILLDKNVAEYIQSLRLEEKSPHTIQKYAYDVKAFLAFIEDEIINKESCKESDKKYDEKSKEESIKECITKELVIKYKHAMIEKGYTPCSINSMLSSINSFLKFLNKEDCRVRHLRTQKKIFCTEEKELTKEEYHRLLQATRNKPRLHMIIETICATGIRVSELRFFTVESVRQGEILVSCKNKTRSILLPAKLRKMLLQYSSDQKIEEGILFRTKNGNPINRSNIWSAMKQLCKLADVKPSKVFPHNLRKLFARTFYGIEKDIAKLADLLGHSNINTTRIYIMTTSLEHQKKIDQLGLVV